MRLVFILLLLISSLFAKPLWISNPTLDGKVLGAVGIAQAHFPDDVKQRVAMMQAKGEISHLINLSIESETNLSDTDSSSSISSKGKLSSDNALKYTVKESYEDIDGTLYLWVVAE